MSLVEYGWSNYWTERLPVNQDKDFVPSRVISEHRNRFWVHSETGDLPARLAGRFNHRASEAEDYPTVGDWVLIEPGAAGDQALIQAILPRRSKFSRKTVGKRTEEQVMAANLNAVWIVSSFDLDLSPERLERYVTLVQESGAEPLVVLAKADLISDSEVLVAEISARMADVPVLAVSTKSAAGLEPLTEFLTSGQTIALLGSSGVGKSTLINHLAGRQVMHTAPVREKDGKGRHTTTHRELVRLPGGALLLDTPGMRELQLWAQEESLEESFSDIEALAERCRFTDCRHLTEPGCAVIEAQEQGLLTLERIRNFQKLRLEIRTLDQNKLRAPFKNRRPSRSDHKKPR